MTVQTESAIQLATIDARLAVLALDRAATLVRRAAWLASGNVQRVRQEDGRVVNLDSETAYLQAQRWKWVEAAATGILTVPIERCA